VLGRQPVVDRYHDRVSAYRMPAGGAVVGVEVANDKAAAMEIHDDRGSGAGRARVGIGWRPIDPDTDRAGRPLDGPVLDPQFAVQPPARQVAEPLARSVDAVIGG
jgi:hypothetical protein